MQGLVCPEMHANPESVEEFITEFRFDSPTNEDKDSGFTPLVFAVISGNIRVVNELITRHNASIGCRTTLKIPELGADRGATALHWTGWCPRDQTHAVVTALLSAGADPNATTGMGAAPPLMAAAMFLNEVAVMRSILTELEPSEPDHAPNLIGAYGRRTSNTNHVPFASFRIEWTSGASAPECGVAGGGDGCHVGRPATIWDLSSAR